eukprot:m.68606 g.68606  ORF g.68606 m.68606 type:complete len:358 (+) comp19907_c0_seq2:56-1129(+)
MREPTLNEIQEASERLAPYLSQTPLLPLCGVSSECRILVKPENLQPVRSYKIRGAGNALLKHIEQHTQNQVQQQQQENQQEQEQQEQKRQQQQPKILTASMGNFIQGLLYFTTKLNLPCSVLVPDNAAQTKLDRIKKMDPNINILKTNFPQWFDFLLSRGSKHPEDVPSERFVGQHFISPVTDQDVLTGNATIGLEIVQAVTDDKLDAILVPWGGGALALGIASAIHQSRPEIDIYAVEVETAAPLAAAFAAGHPVTVKYTPSFVDGIGGTSVLPDAFKLAQDVGIKGSLVVTLEEIKSAIRLLIARQSLVAEGAGAASTAAALKYCKQYKWHSVACIVSGGCLNSSDLVDILQQDK